MNPSPITPGEQQAIQRIADAVQWGTPEMAIGVLRRHVESVQVAESQHVAQEFFARKAKQQNMNPVL